MISYVNELLSVYVEDARYARKYELKLVKTKESYIVSKTKSEYYLNIYIYIDTGYDSLVSSCTYIYSYTCYYIIAMRTKLTYT